jgi:hypothetical protein
LRRPLARGSRRAGLLSPLQLGHLLLDVVRPLDGSDGGYQIHHVRGLAGRQDARAAGREDRTRSLDQVAGALDLRQLESDRAIAPRWQQPPDAKAQRHPIARQGLVDELARERLGRVLERGLNRESGPVAGTLRPSPRPDA